MSFKINYTKQDGETYCQMRHALNLSGTQPDTSKDVDWEVIPSESMTDKYCMVTTYIFFGLKTLLFVIPLVLFAFPITLAAWFYGLLLPEKCDRVSRSCGFYTFFIFLLPFTMPFITTAIIGYFFDSVFYFMFSLPWYLFRRCRGVNTGLFDGYAYINRYRGGPSIFRYLPDVFVALVGQTLRQGIIESSGKLAFMVILLPWIKYYVNTNPWLYSLDERFIQQITTSMNDMEVPQVTQACRQLISQCKQASNIRSDEDHWTFCPHYPYPPDGRNWCIGIQAGGKSISGMFLLVHTTHALKLNESEMRDPNYTVLSNTVVQPIYRVMLWYNNPYHFFTGYVEANVSTGGKYQPDKIHGGEHPMWLLTSRSPLLHDRAATFGMGWVDQFFDWWLPCFVYEIRKLVVGKEYAREHFEKVKSEDGISRPLGICPEEAPEG